MRWIFFFFFKLSEGNHSMSRPIKYDASCKNSYLHMIPLQQGVINQHFVCARSQSALHFKLDDCKFYTMFTCDTHITLVRLCHRKLLERKKGGLWQHPVIQVDVNGSFLLTPTTQGIYCIFFAKSGVKKHTADRFSLFPVACSNPSMNDQERAKSLHTQAHDWINVS